jgi:DNA polymerase I-like protein with 3'-5' exonuclease and polymerase domains
MSVEEAQSVIDEFFRLIPEVKAWQHKVKQFVFNGGDLQNSFGRMRRFHLITKENRANVGREALSFMPQSTANDINMRAAAALWREYGIDVRLCVHDSILANAKPEDAEEVAALIRQEHMRAARLYSDRIPFYSETSIGNNWGELA